MNNGDSQTVYSVPYRKQRHGIMFLFFSIWVLSLPFHDYSVISTYSIDNLLAPFLFLSAIILPQIRDPYVRKQRSKILVAMMILFIFFGLSTLTKFFNARDVLGHETWLVIRRAFYFFVPALYLRDIWSFRVMKKLIIGVAMIGALSSFLVAIGLIHLDVTRFAESRIGEGWIPKSVGLFQNYGDLSILYAFVATLLISHSREELGIMGGRLFKLGIWLVLFLGLVGSQSRNMLFGTLIAMFVYWFWRRFQTAKSNRRVSMIGILLAVIIVLPGVISVFGGVVVNSISSLGGAEAEHTAEWRLNSYKQALSLIAREPLGLSYNTYHQWQSLADHLHNMWLRLLLIGGPFSVIVVLTLFWLVFRGGIKPGTSPLYPSEPALIVASVVGMFIAVEFYGGLSDIMWIMLATLASFSWIRKQRPVEDR